MRHYILTRSAYGPAWTPEANRRRLDLTRAVTARLMAAQTSRNWTWIVLLDRRDPLYGERCAVYAAAAPTFVALPWTSPGPPAPRDRHAEAISTIRGVAYMAYKAPWREAIGERDDRILMTRLDDDDGLAPDAIARYQAAARRVTTGRAILMLPSGVRVWRGLYADVRRPRNAMHTLITPPGDQACVYDYGHAKCERVAPIFMVDNAWGWLWVRHRDTISGGRTAGRPINSAVRATFPVDWKALRTAWS